mgnify:CR=1 FL=1
MNAENLIQEALSNNRQALSEFGSKQLLAACGLPVTREQLAGSREEAARFAEAIGFPVAAKACSPELMHKSEANLIELGLTDTTRVMAAFDRLAEKAGSDIEGILIQEMIAGRRELVLGLIRDPQFGPCVMLGLGGIFTEVFQDTVFRMAPVDRVEAMDMIGELRSRAMLDTFRGQAAADTDALCQAIIAVGQIGMNFEAVSEIDINPLIITPTGDITAVDALVVLNGGVL